MKNWKRMLSLLLTMCILFSLPVMAEDDTHVHAEPTAAAEPVAEPDVPTVVSEATTNADTTPDPTEEPEVTATPEVTAEPEASATPEATAEPEATATPEATVEPEASETPEANADPEVTATPEVSATPEVTAEPEVTATPEASATPEVTDEPEATATPEASAMPEATVEPEATATPEASASPEPTVEAVSDECTDHVFGGTYGYDSDCHWGICANCTGKMLPEESGVDSVHRFTDGICFCGYACEHQNYTLVSVTPCDGAFYTNYWNSDTHTITKATLTYHCSDCDSDFTREERDYTTAHVFGTDGKCVCGGECEHNFTAVSIDDNCHEATCTICGYVAAKQHRAKCTAENTDVCEVCGASGNIAIEHEETEDSYDYDETTH